MQVPTIETERLVLRGFLTDDVDDLAIILRKPAVMRYMPGGKPYSPERTEKMLHSIIRHWTQHGYGWWAIVPQGRNGPIGWCGLTFVEELNETEVAYLLDEPFWGKGITTEAAQAAVRYGFEEVGLELIIALAHTENIASRRVMEKCGLTYTQELHLWGLDLAQYELAQSDRHATTARYELQRPDPTITWWPTSGEKERDTQ